MHWLQAADGVLTGFVQLPFAGGFTWPVPMPVHSLSQLFDQHVSMPLPSWVPFGYFASQAETHAAIDAPPSPPAVPLAPDDDPVLPLEPLDPLPELPPELPFDPELSPSSLGNEVPEHAVRATLAAQTRATRRSGFEEGTVTVVDCSATSAAP